MPAGTALGNHHGMEPPGPAAVDRAVAQLTELAAMVRFGSVRIVLGRMPDGSLRPAGPGFQPPRNWTDDDRAQQLYSELRRLELPVYGEALLRAAEPEESRRTVVVAAIRVGKSFSEGDLIRLLRLYGTQVICTDYLNCGSKLLADEAERWAREHGYAITYSGTGKAATWGAF
jgi:hypothetical protein